MMIESMVEPIRIVYCMHVIEGAHSMSRGWLSTSSRPEDLTEAIIMQHKPINTVENHLGVNNLQPGKQLIYYYH